MTSTLSRIAAHTATRIAVVYLLARALTAGMLLVAAQIASAHSGTPVTPFDLGMRWDSQWYWVVATEGYPSQLPRDDAGNVSQNAWAFMPLFPAIAHALSFVLGSYPLAALAVAFIAGYLSCLALNTLLRERLDAQTSMWAVVLYAAGPLAAIFHMAYAESLFLLWLFLALWCVLRRRFGWLYLLIPLMGYTRPGVLAFALMLGLYGIVRWFGRRTDALPAREIVHIVTLGALAVAVGFSWQVFAAVATGDPSAYLETELSWRRGWTGQHDSAFVPVEGFLQASEIWFGIWGLPPALGPWVLLVTVIAVAAVLIVSPQIRALGTEMRLWLASYLVYLLLVFFPQSSIFRLLLPLAPAYGALALPRHLLWRVGMLVLGLIGQWWWIHEMLARGETFTQIP